jgi:hypothetical protein
MVRHFLLLLGLATATTFSAGGCRSCSTCHDYGPPVANCDCQACGVHRAGSASGGCASGDCETGECMGEPYSPQDGEIISEPQPTYEGYESGQPVEAY